MNSVTVQQTLRNRQVNAVITINYSHCFAIDLKSQNLNMCILSDHNVAELSVNQCHLLVFETHLYKIDHDSLIAF